MEQMTQLERFRAFFAREPMDRWMRYAHYTPPMRDKMLDVLGGREPGEFFGNDDPRGIGLRAPADAPARDWSVYYKDIEIKEKDNINEDGVLRQLGDFYHFSHIVSPLRNATSLDEIEDYPIDTAEQWSDDGMAERVQQSHAEGYCVCGGVGHIYETSWQIRGYEQFLVDLLTQRDWAESILDRVTERRLRMARAAARAGADMIRTGDDIANQKAMMFQPDLWREVFKPRWARVYEAARAENPDIAIWYHSDGNISAVIDDLVEIGVTILNPVQPECIDLEWIQRRYGDRLLFDGTMGTQTTFPWGTPDEMRRTVAAHKELFGTTLILSPTHVLEPEVPPENVLAFFEACDGKKYGV